MATHDQYQQAGVDYSVLDRIKREAIARATGTAGLLAANGGTEYPGSRGASAYVFSVGGLTLAMVVEGLGTKSLIAEEYLRLTGVSRYADIAIDAVGAIVNDVVSVGAVPLVVTAYFSTGSAEWYADARRSVELLDGWQRACEDAGAAWGGGESPALPGLVTGSGIELAGSAIGVVPADRTPVLGEEVAPGDEIVVLASSGLHANGASLARRIAATTEGGLLAALPSGRTFGEALLDPSVLYARFVRDLLGTEVTPTFLNGVTGHGLMKVMRPRTPVRYVIDALPPVPEVLAYMVERSGMSPIEAYGTLNMGLGFVAVVPQGQGAATIEVARAGGYEAILAGHVEAGPRSVVVPHLDIAFGDTDLQLR